MTRWAMESLRPVTETQSVQRVTTGSLLTVYEVDPKTRKTTTKSQKQRNARLKTHLSEVLELVFRFDRLREREREQASAYRLCSSKLSKTV